MKRLPNVDTKYWYEAVVASVYDGDSVRLDVDQGFNQWRLNKRFRLARINAWEIRGEERRQGLAAKSFLEIFLPLGKEVIINTVKDTRGKYGRILVDIYDIDSGDCLNDVLVEAGHAWYQEY